MYQTILVPLDGSKRAEESCREPHEQNAADDPDRPRRLHDVRELFPKLCLGGRVYGHQGPEPLHHGVLGRGDAGRERDARQRQDQYQEGDGRQEKAESEAAGKEEDVVRRRLIVDFPNVLPGTAQATPEAGNVTCAGLSPAARRTIRNGGTRRHERSAAARNRRNA